MQRSPPQIVIAKDCVINMDQHSYEAHKSGRRPEDDGPTPERASSERATRKRPAESPVLDDGMYISDYTTEDDSIEQLVDVEISDSDIEEEVAMEEDLKDADNSFLKDDVFALSFENDNDRDVQKVPQGGVDGDGGGGGGDIYELMVDDVLEEELGDVSSDDESSSGSVSVRSTDGSIDDILDNVPAETFAGDATLGRVFSLRRERHLDMEIDSSTKTDQVNNKERISKVATSSKEQMSVYKNYTVYETVQTTSIVHGQKSSTVKSKKADTKTLAIEAEHQNNETITPTKTQEVEMSPVDTLFSNLSPNAKQASKKDKKDVRVKFSYSDDSSLDNVDTDYGIDEDDKLVEDTLPLSRESKLAAMNKFLESFDEPASDPEFREPSPEILFEKAVEDMSDLEEASSEDWDAGGEVHTDGEDTVDVMIDADEDEESDTEAKVTIDWNKRYNAVVKEVRLKLSQASHNSSTECIGEDRTVSVTSLDQSQYGSERSSNSSVQTSDSDGGGSAVSREDDEYEQPFSEIINETKMLTRSIMSAFAALTEHDESITFSDIINTTVSDTDGDMSVVSSATDSKEPNTPELYKQDNWEMEDYTQSTSKYFINEGDGTVPLSHERDSQTDHRFSSNSQPSMQEWRRNVEIPATSHQNFQSGWSSTNSNTSSTSTQQNYLVTQTTATHQTTSATHQSLSTQHLQHQQLQVAQQLPQKSRSHGHLYHKQCASPDKEIFVPQVTEYESQDEQLTDYSVVSTNEFLVNSNSLPRLKHRVPSEQKLSKTPTCSSSSLNPPLMPLAPVAAKIQKVRLVSLPDHEFQQRQKAEISTGQTADAPVMVESRNETYSVHDEMLYEQAVANQSHSSLGSEIWSSGEAFSQMSTMELPERNNHKNISPLTITTTTRTDSSTGATNIIMSPTVKQAIYYEDYIDSCPEPERGVPVEVLTAQGTDSGTVVSPIVHEVPSEVAFSYHVHADGLQKASCETVETEMRQKPAESEQFETEIHHVKSPSFEAERQGSYTQSYLVETESHRYTEKTLETNTYNVETERQYEKPESHSIESKSSETENELISEEPKSPVDDIFTHLDEKSVTHVDTESYNVESESHTVETEYVEPKGAGMETEIHYVKTVNPTTSEDPTSPVDVIFTHLEEKSIIQTSAHEEDGKMPQEPRSPVDVLFTTLQQKSEVEEEDNGRIRAESESSSCEENNETSSSLESLLRDVPGDLSDTELSDIVPYTVTKRTIVQRSDVILPARNLSTEEISSTAESKSTEEITRTEETTSNEVIVKTQEIVLITETASSDTVFNTEESSTVEQSTIKRSPAGMNELTINIDTDMIHEVDLIHSPKKDTSFVTKQPGRISVSETREIRKQEFKEANKRRASGPLPLRQTDELTCTATQSVPQQRSVSASAYEDAVLYDMLNVEPTETITVTTGPTEVIPAARVMTVPIEPAKSIGVNRVTYTDLLLVKETSEEQRTEILETTTSEEQREEITEEKEDEEEDEEDVNEEDTEEKTEDSEEEECSEEQEESEDQEQNFDSIERVQNVDELDDITEEEAEMEDEVEDDDDMSPPSSASVEDLVGYASNEYLGSVETVIYRPAKSRDVTMTTTETTKIEITKSNNQASESPAPSSPESGNVRVLPLKRVKESEYEENAQREVIVENITVKREETTETYEKSAPEPIQSPRESEPDLIDEYCESASQDGDVNEVSVSETIVEDLKESDAAVVEPKVTTQTKVRKEVETIETVVQFDGKKSTSMTEVNQEMAKLSRPMVQQSRVLETVSCEELYTKTNEQSKVELLETAENFDVKHTESISASVESPDSLATSQPTVQETQSWKKYERAVLTPTVMSSAREEVTREPMDTPEHFDAVSKSLSEEAVADVHAVESVSIASLNQQPVITTKQLVHEPDVKVKEVPESPSDVAVKVEETIEVKSLENVPKKKMETIVEVGEIKKHEVKEVSTVTSTESSSEAIRSLGLQQTDLTSVEKKDGRRVLTFTRESNETNVTVEENLVCQSFPSDFTSTSRIEFQRSVPLSPVQKTIEVTRSEIATESAPKIVPTTPPPQTKVDIVVRQKTPPKVPPRTAPKPVKTPPPEVPKKPVFTATSPKTPPPPKTPPKVAPKPFAFKQKTTTDLKEAGVLSSASKVNRAEMVEVCEVSGVLPLEQQREAQKILTEATKSPNISTTNSPNISSSTVSARKENEEAKEEEKDKKDFDSSMKRIEKHVKKMGNVSVQKTTTQQDLCQTPMSISSCASCVAEGEVKSEEVTTKEMTLVFVWPKGAKVPPNLDKNAIYRELFSRRVTRISDYNSKEEDDEDEHRKKRKALYPKDCGPEVLLGLSDAPTSPSSSPSSAAP